MDDDGGHRAERWTPDESQREVMEAEGGQHLVLAPPGCGKTQILTERILRAHEHGVAYGDMLCLTFTNRAARAMTDRIAGYIDDHAVDEVYVGNVHRYCSRFLFENNVIAAETSIIDEEDAISIIARYLDEDEYAVAASPKRRREYAVVMQTAAFMHQIRHAHPKGLRLHPECITKDDVFAMRKLCSVQHIEFTAKAMLDMYDHTDTYRTLSRSDAYDYGSQHVIMGTLRKMEVAHHYADYKRENRLVDFEDLLLLTYDALVADKEHAYKTFPWVQVDEVQDLNAMQLAIIDHLTDSHAGTVMYFGDEQQAIFSFMGAKVDTLDLLKQRCQGHIHRLSTNHRSPRYLLEVFNHYATSVLHIDPTLLPQSTYEPRRMGNELQLINSHDYDTEVYDVTQAVERLYQENGTETTAVIVSANSDADIISDNLHKRELPHFKVSGEDIFSTPAVKMLLAHFNLLSNENNFIAWSRVLKTLHVFETSAAARNFVRYLLDRAMTPADMLLYDDSTCVQEFVKHYEQDEIVVFDTETTGLDVFEDDIIQIAAVKLWKGEVVKGSEFKIFIETDREIPRKLGDVDNPILEELSHNVVHGHAEALRRFMRYVGNDVLLGHNAVYDYHILDFNLHRYLPEVSLQEQCPVLLDTLKLTRLLEPDLKEYKLKYLLAVLHLKGENSHLADADVGATCSVVRHCYQKAQAAVGLQREALSKRRVQEKADALRRSYSKLFFHSRHLLYLRQIGIVLDKQTQNDNRDVAMLPPALVREMQYVYRRLLDDGVLAPVNHIDYIFRYLSFDMIDGETEPSLKEQLDHHIVEMNTLKEADLCNSNSMEDRIFVSTAHKAKGLEFDNVIIFDAVDGRYPNYYHENDPKAVAEDARKFYVAMTRARHRLYVAQSTSRLDYHNRPQPRQLTRFMKSILHFFN